jgi:TadE-like protein
MLRSTRTESGACLLRAPGPVRRTERGAATAEAVMVMPVLAALTVALVWLLALAAAQTRTVDAAREVARALARDEPRATALELGRRVAPAGADFAVGGGSSDVTVEVSAAVGGPGGLLAFLPDVTVRAEAVAARERQ